MSSSTALMLLGVLMFAALIVTATYAVVTYTHTREIRLRDVSNDGREQYLARTPAGPAVITRVFDDRGEAFEIETKFGGRVGLFYVAPARRVAERRLAELVEIHLRQSHEARQAPR